jgi:2-(3-amino-3-carboxypropyl)histidine synthase
VVLERILAQLRAKNLEFTVVLMSEIFPDKLARLSGIDAWIQVACPRLSIDWGYAFTKPLLSAYEAHLALQRASLAEVYPMDFYRSTDTGPWSNKYKTPEEVAAAKARAANKPKPKLRRKKKKKTPVVVQYES